MQFVLSNVVTLGLALLCQPDFQTAGLDQRHKQALAFFREIDGNVGLSTNDAGEPIINLDLSFNDLILNSDLAHLKGLLHLDTLSLAGTSTSDRDLLNLKESSRLRSLSLYRTKVGDAGLRHLRGLQSLQWLSLSSTRVTGRGLIELGPLHELRSLYLSDIEITDAELD